MQDVAAVKTGAIMYENAVKGDKSVDEMSKDSFNYAK